MRILRTKSAKVPLSSNKANVASVNTIPAPVTPNFESIPSVLVFFEEDNELLKEELALLLAFLLLPLTLLLALPLVPAYAPELVSEPFTSLLSAILLADS